MGRVILLIDDEPNLLRSLSRALRNEPYQILTARSADESVDILKSHQIDLVVSDQDMPGMRGTEFLAWVAEVLPDIPRIMLTGRGDDQVRRQAKEECSVRHFFTKPCNADDLAKAIREALDESESRKQTV